MQQNPCFHTLIYVLFVILVFIHPYLLPVFDWHVKKGLNWVNIEGFVWNVLSANTLKMYRSQGSIFCNSCIDT